MSARSNAGTTHWITRITIIGEKSSLSRCVLADSMVGDRANIEGVSGSVSFGDDTEVRAPRS